MASATTSALAAGAALLAAGGVPVLLNRLDRLSVGRFQVEFETTEAKLLNSVQKVEVALAGEPATWAQIERGEVEDKALREVVAGLVRRLGRLEAVSDRIEVRRQALLETYHNQGLSQSRVSFWFSLALGIFGFGVIVFAVLTKNKETGTYIAGAVTEGVAALFFTQSNQARRLMSEFFEKLRDDRRLEESLNLTDKITDPQLRSSLQALLAMQLVNSKVSPSVLPGFHPEPDNPGQTAT